MAHEPKRAARPMQSLRQLYHQSLTEEVPKAIRELLDRIK
jgi:hypothetical protein